MGVALMESSLTITVAAAEGPVPHGLSALATARLRDRYDAAATVMAMSAVLSAFLAIFIVGATFAFTVAQRRRELALLRLVGARRGQVYRLLLGEAVLLGVAGSAAGVPLGLPAVDLQTGLLAEVDFLPAGFSARLVPWTVVVAVGAGLLVALTGVLSASRRAARVRPLEALREDDSATRVMTLSRWFYGLVLLAGAIALLAATPFAGLGPALALSLGLAIVGGVALSLLSPLLVPLVGLLIGTALRRGTLGTVAEANVRRSVRSSATTAAPLVVLVALLLGLSCTMSAVARATGIQQEQLTDGDLVVETTGANADEVASVPGVAVASPEITVPTVLSMRVVTTNTGSRKTVTATWSAGIVAVDPEKFLRTHRYRPVHGSLSSLRGATFAASEDGQHRFAPGRFATADLGNRTIRLRLVAVLPELLSTSEQFLVPRDALPASLLASAPAQVVVKLTPGTDPARVAATVRRRGIGTATTIADWAASRSAAQQQTDVGLLAILMGLSGLYAVIAVVNAVVMAGSERRREFAALRLTGLTRGQLVRMTLLESLTITAVGLLLGGLVVTGTVTGIAAATARTLGTHVVAVPAALTAVVALGSLLVIAFTSAMVTLSATREAPVRVAAARE